jgi:AraC-like DNA-binding protein
MICHITPFLPLQKEERESILGYHQFIPSGICEGNAADTKKRIEEIAKMAGYYNSAGFIRAFKKYEGITPGTLAYMGCVPASENKQQDTVN